jgi:tRNA(fMet)-specific endonuclease VapC
LSYLLDTCVAINLRDGRGDTAARIAALQDIPFISAVTRVELEGGVFADVAISDKRRRALDALLRRLTVVDFNSEMAELYGQIVARAGFNRRKIIDRMIASSALSLDLTLITANGEDFADIDGLKLEIWKT